MMKNSMKRLLALCMALVMVIGLGATGVQAAGNGTAVSYEKLDSINTTLVNSGNQVEEGSAMYADTDVVRVTITLEEASALEKFGGIPENAQLTDYRTKLEKKQNEIAAAISETVLDGEELDVVWSLTLVTNAMSANVEFGKIGAIAQIDGVASVTVETRYLPLDAETNNIVSQEMTGASTVQDVGYTGAGTRIAVIDTGTDTNHQSFAESGYLYALELNAAEAGMTTEEYIASLDLLTVEEIAAVLTELNAYERYAGLTAEDLYISAKLPFGFNYVDEDLNVTHDYDEQGSHGSHVAGIAAANDYIPAANYYDFNGDGVFDASDAVAVLDYVVKGEFLNNITHADLDGSGDVTDYDAHLLLNALDEGGFFDAAETVGVSGTAPDAQLITMKVFGANGGAYTSDYMAAVEDAVLLGCDVINMSLGSPYEGFTTTYDETYEAIMDAVAEAGIVLTVSAGNSGEWADTDDAYNLMYAEESGVATTTEPSTLTNALSIASADNVAVVSDLTSLFSGNGETVACDFYHPTDVELQGWKTLVKNVSGTAYEVVFLGDPTGLMTGAAQTDSRIYAGSAEDFAGYDFTGKVVLVSRGTYNFGVKHANAALAGAAAVIIYNNVPGSFGALLEGTDSDIPCATISLEEAQALYAISELNEDGLYGCTMTVKSGVSVETVSENVTMSSFSSWGTTGALTIKPEITAPGGSIYSVDGVDPTGTAYETMSGTSMSSPHAAGLSALLAQYIAENGLEETTGLSARQLIQSLLMSTAEPLTEAASGVEYSVRNQGAGLANVENAVNAESYILVDGQPDGKVKAELGDGVEGWSFTFTIHNISGEEMTYALDSSILTTGTTEQDGYALTTSEMVELDASVTYSCGETVTVPANGSAQVTVTIQVPEETAAEMYELGNVNGFYVEGYVYATPVEPDGAIVGVTHSIPMLGWYGDWSDPSMYDIGSLYESLYGTQQQPSHIASYAKNFVALGLAGYDSAFYYTGNIYAETDMSTGEILAGDSRYIEARNALNLTEDRQIEFYAIFPTLLRNASDFKIEVRNADTGEVYFVDEYSEYVLNGCFYYSSYGYIYDMTMNTGIGTDLWDYTDMNGEPIPEGTNLTFAVVCATEYYTAENGYENWENIGEGAELAYTFTVDNTAPELADIENNLVVRGDKLYYTVQDNNYIASVILMNGTATEIVAYSFPDMDEEQRGLHTTGSLDLEGYVEQYGNKAVIAVCDYAGNESYYAVNLNGEGESFDDLVAFQYSNSLFGTSYNSWVSFGEGVNANETGMFVTGMNFVNAEYVGGFVYAQTEDGKLYGIPYADMVANTVDLESTFVAQLDNVYQDLAYSYAEGNLFGLYTSEYDGYPTSEIYRINIQGEYYDEDMWTNVAAYQEDWFCSRGGVYGLTMTIDDTGSIYVLGSNYDWDTEGLTETAYLWKAAREVVESSWGSYVDYTFAQVGDTGLAMDYLQSMTFDHNTGKLYWARFYPVSWLEHACELILVDAETAACEKVGTLSGETCAMFAPLTAETAAQELYQNIPNMDTSVVAAPVLGSSNATMSIYSSTTLSLSFDPWYSDYTDVVWTSSDESVVTVDQNGYVTAVGEGSATVTVTNTADETLFDTCTIEVTALDLRLEGIVSAQGTGIGNVSGAGIYEFTMEKGVGEMKGLAQITASEELNFGLSLTTSEKARGSIWAVEYGNAGMIYEIDAASGEVKDVLQPIDGDILFGLSYSEDTDTFAAIMNMYLYVDLALTHEEQEEMLNSYDEELKQFTYHKVDMLPYLLEANGGFVTGENGQGASSEIVFCGITTLEGGYYFEDTYKDYTGGWASYELGNYTADQTLVLLDNVGRLWYIDEITGMTKTTDDWGNATYTGADGTTLMGGRSGVFDVELGTNDDGSVACSVFNIRKIDETPLTDMFRDGTMPRYTYHFSDIELAGYTSDGAPMFALSLYDYWNNGTTNELYLYIPGVGTGEWVMDYETWESYEVKTPDRFYSLGNTGEYNIIATIHEAEVTGGVETDEVEQSAVNALTAPLYTE